MEHAIIYPREKKVGIQAISVHWLRNIFPKAKLYFLDSAFQNKARKILISCHFENNYPYILQILRKIGISIFRKKRKEELYFGGPVAINPYPLYHFVNYFLIGDFDSRTVKTFIESEEKEKFDFAFIPERKEHANVNRKREFCYYAFHDNTLFLEVQSGCRNACAFCLLSWSKKLSFCSIEQAKKIVNSYNPEEVYLIGSDLFSHPYIEELLDFLKTKKVKISFPSSRIEEIEKFKDLLKELKPESFTIAPESSERIRLALSKKFTNEQVLQSAELLKKLGVKRLKLYFILGLPGERQEDLEEIVMLIQNLRKTIKISASFSIFVPKAHTPMQFAPFESIASLKRKNLFLKRELRSVKTHFTNPKKAFIQMLLSIGNKEISKLLANVFDFGLNYSVWVKKARLLGINLEKYSKEKPYEYKFDFESVETGISKKTLWKVYEKYKKEVI